MTESQAWVLICVAAISAMLGFLSLRETRRIARQKATLDFVAFYNGSPRVDDAHRVIHKYGAAPVEKSVPLRDQLDDAERGDFLFLMNLFESLAVGLTHDIYDRKMIADIFGADLREIHKKANQGNLIDAARAETPDAPDFLIEYEKFVSALIPSAAN